MIRYKADSRELGRSVAKWQKRFGETNRQALARIAVAAARGAAVKTKPPGKSKRGIVASINYGARQVISPRPAAEAEKIRSAGRAYFGGQWVKIDRGQVLDGPEAINAFIDRQRDSRGRTRPLPDSRKGIAKQAQFNKAMAARRRRAGMAKGGWIGAGIRAGKLARGDRATIGKGFMAWAQKHRKLGTAKRRGGIGRPEIRLTNRAFHSGRLLSRADRRRAVLDGIKRTLQWYKRAVRAMDRK